MKKIGKMDNLGEKNRNFKWIWLMPEFAVLALALLGVYGVGWFRQLSREEMLRNLVMTAVGVGMVGYLIRQGCREDMLDYDNGKHVARFWGCFSACLVISLACSFLPVAGWPYVVVFVMLALFSNGLVGILSASVLLMLSAFLSGGGFGAFMLYFISGALAVAFFQKLDNSFKVGIPVLISMMVLLVSETANLVLFQQEHLQGEMFVIPAVNVIISSILLLCFLKLFSSMVTYKYRLKYMEIADTGCKLLVDFKEAARKEYFQSIHTAHFCESISRRLGMDADAVKAAGYYHKIGHLCQDTDSFEQVDELMEEYRFPPMVRRILWEYLSGDAPILMKETAVLVFSSAVTTSVLYMFAQDQNIIPDYDKLIDAVFRKKIDSGILRHCAVTLQEITAMKRIFKEEKLYYDFLR